MSCDSGAVIRQLNSSFSGPSGRPMNGNVRGNSALVAVSSRQLTNTSSRSENHSAHMSFLLCQNTNIFIYNSSVSFVSISSAIQIQLECRTMVIDYKIKLLSHQMTMPQRLFSVLKPVRAPWGRRETQIKYQIRQ